MAELVDAHDSKSCIAICESSSLSSGTSENLWERVIIKIKLSRGRAVRQLAWLITKRSLVRIQPPQHARANSNDREASTIYRILTSGSQPRGLNNKKYRGLSVVSNDLNINS